MESLTGCKYTECLCSDKITPCILGCTNSIRDFNSIEFSGLYHLLQNAKAVVVVLHIPHIGNHHSPAATAVSIETELVLSDSTLMYMHDYLTHYFIFC
jgi:hypothetical protein